MERYVHGDHRQMQSSVPSCGFVHLSEETHPEVCFSPMPGCRGLVSAKYLGEGLRNVCIHVTSLKINGCNTHSFFSIRENEGLIQVTGITTAHFTQVNLILSFISRIWGVESLLKTPGRVSKVNMWTLLLPLNADSRLLELGLNILNVVLLCSHHFCNFHTIVVNLNSLIGILEFPFQLKCIFDSILYLINSFDSADFF